jgi:ABC-type transport system involved in cytochrome bd biosynthesis fused ATPase/permease subunit
MCRASADGGHHDRRDYKERDLGGQGQRLAPACDMMRGVPLLLILDEPTASLDAITEAALPDAG